MITSKDNPKLKSWIKLKQAKYRKKEKMFIVEGEHLVEEALKANIIEEIIIRDGESYQTYEKFTVLPKNLFNLLTQTVTPTGILAICHIKKRPITKNRRLLIVDNVQDPGNLGTLIRSALAFNFDGIIFSNETVDPFNEKVVRASQGAIFHIPFLIDDLPTQVSELKKEGVKLYATNLSSESVEMSKILPRDLMAFIVGNEGAGVGKKIIDFSDEQLIINMSSKVESLNVGVAGSLIMHHFNGL